MGARRTRALKVDAATERAQADASSPAGSAWVSANAGSGKTFVLARRVVRLLLDGTNPGRILCLTFTKAAAAEMAKRVFKELAAWTAMDDVELADEIARIEGQRPDATLVAEARRLFARALETPGGLKIQTIHAFCERLLHQFPFEANVAGHFEVLDGQDAAALSVEARKRMLAKAEREPEGGPFGRALRTVLGATSDIGHEAAIAEFINRRDRLRVWIVDSDSLERGLAELKARLGLAPGDTVESKRSRVLSESVFTVDDLAGLVAALRLGGRNDCQAAERLAAAAEGKTEPERIDGYLAFFMTGSREKLRETSSLVSRTVKNRIPGLEEALEDERVRLETVLDGIAAAECYETSAAMLRLADAAIGEYARLKNARGVLDFDDLIVKTANLLSRVDMSAWVHYKLDRGLDHILVDEAQDTSPRQWQVIKALAEEFFAGEGAASATRTLFAVGDEKQSIFSFQGAVPAWFSKMQRDLGGKARAASYAWADVKLHISFRSTPVLLSAVDKVFAEAAAHRGVTADPDWPPHTAHRRNVPGRVTIWPMIKPPDRTEPEDWRTPLDHLGRNSPEVKLADRIAKTIARWRADKEVLESTGEPIRPGGILILVRTRGALTDAINRELKRNNVPIAGADRLALTDHIAVMDLMALGRVMVLPEDDLSLAAVLKSPLIGFSEDQLYSLAHERPGSLWDRLRHTADEAGGVFAEALAKLEAWRSFGDYLDPHGFFARVLGPDQGRKNFFRRLGVEAEDVLDEFLAQALVFERTHTPSMEAFLTWLEAAETEIKRDAELLRDEVRVMTVHGAKGLEADVVFLVDNGTVPVHPSHDARVLSIDDDTDATAQPPLLWMRSSKAMPQIVSNRVAALRGKAEEEYRRLLYVGMTRAKDRLIVCGTEKMRGTDAVAGWHGLVRNALEPESLRVEAADGTLESLEWRAEEAPRARHKPEQQAMTLVPPLPEWIDQPAPQAIATRRITPSTVLQGEAGGRAPRRRFDLGNPAALERGRLVHRLLQSLPDFPEDHRRDIGRRYLEAVAPKEWSAAERMALLDGVMGVLGDPAFAPVFAAGSRAEIDVAGIVHLAKGPATLSGRIDRLAVTDDRVLIVDYKTNRPAPESLDDAPSEYVAQLALYRELLGRLYPNKAVAAAILWTERPALMEIPSSTLERALATIVEA